MLGTWLETPPRWHDAPLGRLRGSQVVWMLLAAPVIGVVLEIWNWPARLDPAPGVAEESA